METTCEKSRPLYKASNCLQGKVEEWGNIMGFLLLGYKREKGHVKKKKTSYIMHSNFS